MNQEYYDKFKKQSEPQTEEWKNIKDSIDEYKIKKLEEIYNHFGTSQYIESPTKELILNKFCLMLLDKVCIFKMKRTQPIQAEECTSFVTKLYHRIKEIKFNETTGLYDIIVYKYCQPNKKYILKDYTQYVIYELDKSEFDNEEIKKLKYIYEYEDSISKRNKIKQKIDAISTTCFHYFEDDKNNPNILICKKCGINYNKNDMRGFHNLK